jgi:wyosine [tRNA(Phe)-imidazoG37] synthetase (radical SAM superfamily)
VYCQLGRTNDLRIERARFYPREDILAEIERRGRTSAPDYITFVGDGEPTLCRDLGWLLRQTKTTLGSQTAVITNGSLLFREDVRRDLAEADVVIPSLDCGTAKTFQAINRPHGKLKFSEMLQGQIDFRHEYHGQIWLEIMLVRGLNDGEAEPNAIRMAVDSIRPDRVYVITPIRPPAESWVRPPDPLTILKAQESIAEAMPLTSLESGDFGLPEYDDPRRAIIEIGSRHPLRREQMETIEHALGAPGMADRMLKSGELVDVEYNGSTYLLPRHFVRNNSSAN